MDHAGLARRRTPDAARPADDGGHRHLIGTQITHAAGLAMACQYRKTDEAVLGFMGDGATSSNDFHAGMNFAAVRKAPIVFDCQNNQWSIPMPVGKQIASDTIAAKAIAYGMSSRRVDGNDVLAVQRVVETDPHLQTHYDEEFDG